MKKVEITDLLEIAQHAGQEIMRIYETGDINVEYKKDESPLTAADTASHAVIKESLKELYPEIPIISEEGKNIAYGQRKDWNCFWLVDPLDGTKEFIKRNGEFTVNIALVEEGQPTVGVVFAPALGILYFADKGKGAYKRTNGSKEERIYTNSKKEDELTAIQSRSHSSSAEEEFFSRYSVTEYISKGSSLKFCLVAESTADIYFRSGPTWEWDTAAGHAVVTAAGGKVVTGNDDLTYNKATLKNDDGFICVGNEKLLAM